VFPGHQGDIQNNVYLVKADGVSVMQTGDQSNPADFKQMDAGTSKLENI